MIATTASTEMFISAKRSLAILLTPPPAWTYGFATLAAFFLSLPQSYRLLLTVMLFSLASSALVALKLHRVSAWDAFWSVVRVFAELGLLYLTHLVFDGFANHLGVPLASTVTAIVALIFTGIEFLSFTEDCKVLKVPVPRFVTSRMKQLIDKLEATGEMELQTQTTKLSPAGNVLGIEQSVTVLRPTGSAPEPPIVIAPDIVGKKDG